MMVALYRWRLKPGSEDAFRSAWEEGTRVRLTQGSGGSALFRGPDGLFWAIARWPDGAARDAAFASLPATDAGVRMAECVLETYDALELTAVADLWTAFPEGRPLDR